MTVKTPVTAGRRSVRLASVAAAATLAGLLSGPGSAVGASDAVDAVAYDCQLPSGSGRVSMEVRADFPESGETGVPMSPQDVSITVALSGADLASLLPAGSTTVMSTATLDVEVAQNDRTAQAQWTDFAAPATPLGVDEDVRLVHAGEVPSVTVGAAGDVTLTAGKLKLDLRAVADGQATGAAPVVLPCERSAQESGLLATVPVTGDTAPGATPTTQPGGPGEDGGGRNDAITVTPRDEPAEDPANPCPVDPPVGEMDTGDAPKPAPGADLTVRDLPGAFPGCAFAVGMANVRKLDGAMIINDPAKNPALISVYANKRSSTRRAQQAGGSFNQFDSIGNLKLPDAESTFLAFGFQPVSARVEFENGPLTISTGTAIPHPPVRENFAVASFMQSLRLYDVKVNGVALDVGRNCRTADPFKVVLRGDFEKDPKYLNVLQGGLLSGVVNIPEFSGCGSGGEDLDPLFTASISGPDNAITMNQGTTCIPIEPSTICPPSMPTMPGTNS
ncbi:DUF6801 domain-containing protein [Streptomyces sp. NPDC058231]|uniref:DUF6801 domain-containing protein n=1 Tax=Streptomyces sp. NPDC058231 TaxID=3346392 RepID=UPI0036EBB73B